MQGNDYLQSAMYRHKVTCFDCHDAHGTGNYAEKKARKAANVSRVTCRKSRRYSEPQKFARILLRSSHPRTRKSTRFAIPIRNAIKTDQPVG